MHERTLHRTTEARRALKAARAGPPAPGKRKGRAEYAPDKEAAMLEAAASVITLTRKFGPGKFSEAMIRVYPSLREHQEGANTAARFYAPAPDVTAALNRCSLPAPLLLVWSFAICRPIPANVSLRIAGRKFVDWIARDQKWVGFGNAIGPVSPPDRLTKAALLSLYEYDVTKGRIQISGHRAPVCRMLAGYFGLSIRMRKYWREHPKSAEAVAVIKALFNRGRDEEGDGSGEGVFERPALVSWLQSAGSVSEKEAAQKRALVLWSEYKEHASRRTVSYVDSRRLTSADVSGFVTGSEDSEDFRDAIEY